MADASTSARMRDVLRLGAAQRQFARAEMLAANAKLATAEACVTQQADHRDAALGLWREVLSDRIAVPQMISHAGNWVMDSEAMLREAERTAEAALDTCEQSARTYAVASARDEVAQALLAAAIRDHDRRLEERFSIEAQDLLLHRRKP